MLTARHPRCLPYRLGRLYARTCRAERSSTFSRKLCRGRRPLLSDTWLPVKSISPDPCRNRHRSDSGEDSLRGRHGECARNRDRCGFTYSRGLQRSDWRYSASNGAKASRFGTVTSGSCGDGRHRILRAAVCLSRLEVCQKCQQIVWMLLAD